MALTALAAEVQQSRSSHHSRKAAPSRSGKRRAEIAAEESEHDHDGNDAEERHDPHGEDIDMGTVTPDRSDLDFTENETDTGAFTPTSSKPHLRKDRSRSQHQENETGLADMDPLQGLEEVPPQRELPFQRRISQTMEHKAVSSEKRQEDEESTDDEL